MEEGAMGGESVQRPKSIVMFERCYLAAFAISLVSTVLMWSSLNEQFGAQELLLGGWFLPTVTVIVFSCPLRALSRHHFGEVRTTRLNI